MVKNILAIIGSPRKKGNSYQLTKKVEDILNQFSSITTDYIFLQDMHLGSCIGCHSCIFTGEENCPLDDDRDIILEKMKQADGVIFVSPTYVLNVSALFKNFIDHFAFLCHRPLFFNTPAMLVSTTGGMGVKDTLKLMKTPISIWGFHITSELGLQTPPMKQLSDVFQNHKKKILKETRKFHRMVTSKKRVSPRLFALVQFHMFKRISFEYPDTLKADYQFYKSKKDQFFYTTQKINPLKKAAALFLVKLFLLLS